MAWRAITEADLLTRISGPELESFREAGLAQNQEDPIAASMTQVTGTIRGYVAACAKNTLGPEGTIPAASLGSG